MWPCPEGQDVVCQVEQSFTEGSFKVIAEGEILPPII